MFRLLSPLRRLGVAQETTGKGRLLRVRFLLGFSESLAYKYRLKGACRFHVAGRLAE